MVTELTHGSAFDVGINDRLPAGQLAILGLQHVFGMTGMFVFPGLLGRSFNLPEERIAYLYGMTFVVCGLITVLQSVWLLRLPLDPRHLRWQFCRLAGRRPHAKQRSRRRLRIFFCGLANLVLIERTHPPI